MGLTNVERIHKYIKEEGVDSISIHKLPGLSIWLVAKQKRNKNWEIAICNPWQTKAKKLFTDATDEDYFELWRLLIAEAHLHKDEPINQMTKTLKKKVTNYYICKTKTTQKLLPAPRSSHETSSE